MAQNDTHVALIILLTEMWGGGIIGGKNFFGPKFVFLRLRLQHPFLHKTIWTYGPVYSVCAHQPKAIWVWNAVHCEPAVAHTSRAVQTVCGRPLYMTGERQGTLLSCLFTHHVGN